MRTRQTSASPAVCADLSSTSLRNLPPSIHSLDAPGKATASVRMRTASAMAWKVIPAETSRGMDTVTPPMTAASACPSPTPECSLIRSKPPSWAAWATSVPLPGLTRTATSVATTSEREACASDRIRWKSAPAWLETDASTNNGRTLSSVRLSPAVDDTASSRIHTAMLAAASPPPEAASSPRSSRTACPAACPSATDSPASTDVRVLCPSAC